MLCDLGNSLIYNEYGAAKSSSCDECDVDVDPGFETAPSSSHHESCSLYLADPPLGDVKVTRSDVDPVRLLGSRLLDWAAVAPTDREALERFSKAIEFSTIPEAAADIASSLTARVPCCEECGAATDDTYESAPSPLHEESCSLYEPDEPTI
jgi:hypothetical protein